RNSCPGGSVDLSRCSGRGVSHRWRIPGVHVLVEGWTFSYQRLLVVVPTESQLHCDLCKFEGWHLCVDISKGRQQVHRDVHRSAVRRRIQGHNVWRSRANRLSVVGQREDVVFYIFRNKILRIMGRNAGNGFLEESQDDCSTESTS